MRNKKIAAIFMIAVLLVSVFVFAACEDPAVKVIYKDINPKYETDDSVEEYITVGEAEIKPDMTLLELSKDGFALEAWTTDKEGQNVFDPTKTYTQNVVVYAKWHRLPAMPANLAYDPDTHTVSWTAVSGATGYMIQLDDNAEQLVVSTTYDLPEKMLNGTHTFKVTAKENNYSSQTANLSFSVNREQPKQYVSFYVGDEMYRRVEIADGSVELPAPPTEQGYAFAGWTTDKEGKIPFENSDLVESLSVYAQFKKLPQTVSPRYVAKTQTIEWSYTGGDAASFVVSFEGKETTIDFVEGQSAYSFALPQGLTDDSDYTVEIVTVSVNEVDGEALRSEKAVYNFTYSVIGESSVTVTFMVDGKEYDVKVVNSSGTILLPQEPTKKGYVFDKWTTDEAGANVFNPSNITESVVVYAQWTARPSAPQSVSFDATSATISWDAIDGIEEYWYKLDNMLNFAQADGTSFVVRSLSAGKHTVTVYTVAGGIKSEEVELEFDADAPYVWFRNADGTLIAAVKVEDGKVTLPANPSKTGYVFSFWTVAAEFASDTFDNEGINSYVSVYAQFVALPEIGDYEINGNNFVWTWNADSNVNYYEVRFDSESARVSRATIAAGVATYSLNTTQIVLTPGVHKLIITAVEENGRKTELGEFDTEIVFDSDISYVDGDGKLIRESIGSGDSQTTVFVFFVGTTYRFDSYTFTEKGNEHYSVSGDNDNTLTINKAVGSITIPTANGVEIKAKFVEQAASFIAGDTIQAFRDNTGENSIFLKKEGDYNVGVGNDFILDTDLITYHDRLSKDSASVEVTVDLERKDGAPIKASDYFTVVAGEDGKYRLVWKQSADTSIDSALILSIRPKYLTREQNENAADYTVRIEFKLNDGVNVYDHDGLKKNFNDSSVHIINLHGDITAELAADQKNPDGTAINYHPYSDADKPEGSVYHRVVTAADTFTLNGNFFTVDASKKDESGNLLVPRIKWSQESENTTQGQGKPMGDMDVQTIQIGLFVVYNFGARGGAFEDAEIVTNYNNLHIIGNSEMKGNNEDITEHSGGHAGILTRDADANLNNVYANNFSIAYYFDTNEVTREISIVDCFADNNWQSSLYGWSNAKITLDGCDFGNSFGGAIHIEDCDNSNDRNPELVIKNTKINNWKTGNEAWFAAYGAATLAAQLKSAAQASVSQLGYSMLKKNNNEEIFNFAIVFKPADQNWDNGTVNTSRVKFTLVDGDNSVSFMRENGWYTDGTDQRISSGMFGFPVGAYSNWSDFAAAVLANGGNSNAVTLKAFQEGFKLADGQQLMEIVTRAGALLGGNNQSLVSLFVTYGQGGDWYIAQS